MWTCKPTKVLNFIKSEIDGIWPTAMLMWSWEHLLQTLHADYSKCFLLAYVFFFLSSFSYPLPFSFPFLSLVSSSIFIWKFARIPRNTPLFCVRGSLIEHGTHTAIKPMIKKWVKESCHDFTAQSQSLKLAKRFSVLNGRTTKVCGVRTSVLFTRVEVQHNHLFSGRQNTQWSRASGFQFLFPPDREKRP